MLLRVSSGGCPSAIRHRCGGAHHEPDALLVVSRSAHGKPAQQHTHRYQERCQYLLLVRLPSPVVVGEERDRRSAPAAPIRFHDQSAAVVELRNENQQLRNQIERLRRELEDKYKSELAAAVADKERQIREQITEQLQEQFQERLQKQVEAKEATWRAETETRLSDERRAAERRWTERDLRHADERRVAEAERDEERRTWRRNAEALAQRADEAVAEKERLEKRVRLEVEHRVQAYVQRYEELKQETSSLQTVLEMRTLELRNAAQHLETAKMAASEASVLRERNLTLANTIEDLHVQLERRAAEERRLASELAKFEAGYKEASNRIRALTSLKDQLEWRLQQRHQSPTHHACYVNDGGDRASPVRVHQAPGFTSTPSETPKSARKTFTFPPSGLSPILSENSASADAENENNNNNIRCGSRGSSSTSRRSSTDAAAGNDASGSDLDDVFNGSTSPSAADAAATQLLATAADPSAANVRDVTKKVDSISYVLELGDGQPADVLPPSPWQRRRALGRSYSLRAPKHSKSH